MDSNQSDENDSKKRNDLKRNFYDVFKRKIELDIIDMVLSNCDYNGKQCFDRIIFRYIASYCL